MSVVDKTENPEAKADLVKENRDVEDRKRNAVNAVVSSLDLPTHKKEEPVKEEPKKEEPGKEDPAKTETPEFTEEELINTPDEDLTEEGIKVKNELIEKKEEGDEELIPKSKVDKRFRDLTEKIRKLEAERSTEKTEPDADTARLEKMSVEKLKTLKQNVRRETRESNKKIAVGETVDDKHLDELDVLSDKIDDALDTYSARFRDRQVDKYNQEAERLVNDPDVVGTTDADLKKASMEIKEIAEKIYTDYPKLHQTEDGQALALRLAVDHWKTRKESFVGKSKVVDLRKSNKKLLRKTTLDVNVLKVDRTKKNLSDLRKKAGRGGTDEDRQTFIKSDPMFNVDSLIPDEFKEK